MKNLKKWLSTKAYRHVKVFLFVFIVFFNIFVVLIGGIAIHCAAPQSYPTVGTGMWQIFTDILDPGFLGSIANGDRGGTAFTVCVEVFVILVCMVTFTGAIIGYIANMITSILENAVAGPKQMYLKNHILILNWNNRAAGILAEYLYTEICEDVVVLSSGDRDTITKEIEEQFYESGYNKRQKHVNFIVKQGDPFSATELNAICADRARTIIVLSDSNPVDGELRTLKTVMMVSQMNRDRSDCTIVVETDNKNVYELVERVSENNTVKIIPAYLNKLLGKLLAHIALQPRLNVVFAELFSHSGSEFFSVPIKDVFPEGEDWEESRILDRFMAEYNRAIPLLTTRGFHADKEDRIFMLSGEKSHTGLKRSKAADECAKLTLKDHYVIPRKIIILLGSNSKMEYILNSFQAYIANYGEENLSVYFVDTLKHLEQIPESVCFHKIEIKNRYNILEIREVLKKFDLGTIDTIVILSDDTVAASEYDMGALISLIDINKEISNLEKEKRPEIIVEILNPNNYEIVRQYNIDNVIVSNKYISSMVAQLGDDSTIFKLIYDILTFDGEIDDFGLEYSATKDSKELYIKRCGDYFEEVPVFRNRFQLIRSVFEASGKQHIPIGIIFEDSSKNEREDGVLTYILNDHLDDEKELVLSENDQLILFASEW